jgi:hypothetical protein
LSVKQRNSLINDLLVRLLLAYAGGEIRRVGVHLKNHDIVNGVIAWSIVKLGRDTIPWWIALLMVFCDSIRALNSIVLQTVETERSIIGEIANEFAITCYDWGRLLALASLLTKRESSFSRAVRISRTVRLMRHSRDTES